MFNPIGCLLGLSHEDGGTERVVARAMLEPCQDEVCLSNDDGQAHHALGKGEAHDAGALMVPERGMRFLSLYCVFLFRRLPA